MTEDERALLLAVAKAITSRLDTPFTTQRDIRNLVQKIKGEAKE